MAKGGRHGVSVGLFGHVGIVLEKIDYANPKACRVCPQRARCTNDVRSVSRFENEDALDRMAERLKARLQILDRRREIVEHPFGSIKQWMYQGAFLMRGPTGFEPLASASESRTGSPHQDIH